MDNESRDIKETAVSSFSGSFQNPLCLRVSVLKSTIFHPLYASSPGISEQLFA